MPSASFRLSKAGRPNKAALTGVAFVLLVFFLASVLLQGCLNLGSAPGSSSAQQAGEIDVHFIDVGQGDCVFIATQTNAVLIDAGVSSAGERVVSYIRSLGIEILDAVICTHPHNDHIGGMTQVLKSFDVKEIYLPDIPDKLLPTTKIFMDLLEEIEKKGLEISDPAFGKRLVFAGWTLTFLGPTGSYNDLNNYSIVTKMEYNGFTALFGGDIEKKAEQELLKKGVSLKADLFKLSHHGSSTSNTQAFLKAVDADYYVACVGEDNSYDHPNREVMDRVRAFGKPVYLTSVNGTIVFTYQDNRLSVRTQK